MWCSTDPFTDKHHLPHTTTPPPKKKPENANK
jgi:hypothetical protein